MKLKDTLPNHVYSTTVYVDDQSPAVSTLIYVWDNTFSDDSHKVKYEIIAFPFSVITIFFNVGNADLQEVSDLLLYVHFFYKTTTFENLLKGSPVNEITVLRKEIEVLPLKPSRVYYSKTLIPTFYAKPRYNGDLK
jgi:hypothetical protein